MQKNISNQYKEAQVKTANQGKLIVMMYEGAIKFINIALENLPTKKYDVVNNNIIRAQDIITELMISINFEAGEFSQKLYSLYTYMNRRLVEGNIKKDEKPLKEVLGYLTELKESWQKVANMNTNNDPAGDVNRGGLNIST